PGAQTLSSQQPRRANNCANEEIFAALCTETHVLLTAPSPAVWTQHARNRGSQKVVVFENAMVRTGHSLSLPPKRYTQIAWRFWCGELKSNHAPVLTRRLPFRAYVERHFAK